MSMRSGTDSTLVAHETLCDCVDLLDRLFDMALTRRATVPYGVEES